MVMGNDSKPAKNPAGSDQTAGNALDQNELDELLLLNGFLTEDSADGTRKSLLDEIRDAVLDSGKLSLPEWRALRDRLKEIERLIPHIDLIIDLKSVRRETRPADHQKSPRNK
jgi:hypothetical protein